ncbi:MAG: phosphate signaling complex protein PhoU [Firmicutes bacterium]|nr:phosphate signaling complex protein PhoU [Bacillota bacterium]MCL5058236.1 phosphate signaling complex protein PhoU [Actinomycetota bacterium]
MVSRNAYEKSIKEIEYGILRMGGLVEQAVYNSVQALLKMDTAAASRVITGDDVIDQLFSEIEDKCVKLVATQQPMAKDLRIIITGIKILVNLERMADYTVDIARITMELSGYPVDVRPFEYIQKMAVFVQKMVKDGLDAYLNGDIEKAGAMCRMDDEVDKLFSEAFKELIERMKGDPDMVVQHAYSLFIGRYLERIADHATNIGEEVIYIATGERKELN